MRAAVCVTATTREWKRQKVSVQVEWTAAEENSFFTLFNIDHRFKGFVSDWHN